MCVSRIFCLALLPLFLPDSGGAADQATIAVLDFQATNAPSSDAAVITQFVRGGVVRARRYRVVDKSNMDKILGEQAFQQTGCTSQECAVKLGRILNVQKMIVGDYTVVGSVKYLTASLVDVETGQIENAATEKGFSVSQIDETVDRLIASLIGSSAKAAGEGRASGRTAKGRFGVGLNVPGLSLRYFVANNLALETRGQMGKGSLAAGPRGYAYIPLAPAILSYAGLEGDYLRYNGDSGKCAGYGAEAFAGLECFVWPRLSVQCDFGPAYLRLADANGIVVQSGLSFIVNFGINFYFGGGQEVPKSERLYQEAVELYKAKDYDGAWRIAAEAANRDPNHWKSWALIGNCQYSKGDRVGSLSSFDRSLQINPDNPQLRAWVDGLRAK